MTATRRPQRSELRAREERVGWALVAPHAAGFLLFALGPVIAVFVISTFDVSLLYGNRGNVGLEHYVRLMSADATFRQVMVNTAIFTLGLVPINVVLALFLAILLNRRLAGARLFQGIFFLPVITAAAAWAIVWTFLLQGRSGAINQSLALFGIDGPNWLRHETWAMVSVVTTRALKTVGLKMVIFLAALQNVPVQVVEAARVDGASEWQINGRIVLPLISPTILVVIILTVIGSFQVFDHILLMTNGGPGNATSVLVLYIYRQAFRLFEAGYASGLAVVLFVISVAFAAIQWAARRRWVYGEA